MPPVSPAGEPVPADGALPELALTRLGSAPLGIYVHVPFCAARCGYCDFNTYTPSELGTVRSTAQPTFVEAAVSEIRLARKVLGDGAPPVQTVFFGGGTPTLLPSADLRAILTAISAEFGLTGDAEITTEANPDSVTRWDLEALRTAGFNRISFGMQSAVGRVLHTLDRTHDPLRVPAAMAWARLAGFEQVSLDLIYGTPGESMKDWETSLESALTYEPDHISAYALIVERGTQLHRRIKHGELARPDDDDQADKYVMTDNVLTAAGFDWYEISNWSRDEASRCRHNLQYWTGGHWWGIGPGAHSHVGGVRWWNVKHPTTYAVKLAAGFSPAQGREILGRKTRRVERVMLEIRLRTGLAASAIDYHGHTAVPSLVERGLVTSKGHRLVLTRKGRLLADTVVRELLPLS
ncbi:MAG: radical SAM family heme chaperone HemW [Nocardioides sp.]